MMYKYSKKKKDEDGKAMPKKKGRRYIRVKHGKGNKPKKASYG